MVCGGQRKTITPKDFMNQSRNWNMSVAAVGILVAEENRP
jgi:hypothetical protein